MGEPNLGNARLLCSEYIATWGRPGEVKHLSNQRKRKQQQLLLYPFSWLLSRVFGQEAVTMRYGKKCDSVSSGERTRNSPNLSGVRKSTEILRKILGSIFKGQAVAWWGL